MHLEKGWYGLGAAKQYHCTQPEKSLAIIDSGNSLGGTVRNSPMSSLWKAF